MDIYIDGNIGIYKRTDLKPRRKNKKIEDIKISDFTDKCLYKLDICLFVDDDNSKKILEFNMEL